MRGRDAECVPALYFWNCFAIYPIRLWYTVAAVQSLNLGDDKVKANLKAKTGAKKAEARRVEAKRRGPATLDSEEARRRINIRWARPGARAEQSEAVRARLALKAKEEAKAERAAKKAAKEAAAKAEAAKAKRKAARGSRKTLKEAA